MYFWTYIPRGANVGYSKSIRYLRDAAESEAEVGT